MATSEESPDEGFTITAEGAKVMASEKVSTGDYENAQVSTSLDVSIEGVDVTESVPDPVRKRLYAMERELQSVVEAAAEERQGE